jgi:hypothetical protein
MTLHVMYKKLVRDNVSGVKLYVFQINLFEHWSGFGGIQTVRVFGFFFMAFWLSYSGGDLVGLFWN